MSEMAARFRAGGEASLTWGPAGPGPAGRALDSRGVQAYPVAGGRQPSLARWRLAERGVAVEIIERQGGAARRARVLLVRRCGHLGGLVSELEGGRAAIR